MPLIFMFFVLPLIVVALVSASILDDKNIQKNAEFEATNCPEMLQVDSKYCKPIGDK